MASNVLTGPLTDAGNQVKSALTSGGTNVDNAVTDINRQGAAAAAQAAHNEAEQNDAYTNKLHGKKSDQPLTQCKTCPKPTKDKVDGKVEIKGGIPKVATGGLSETGSADTEESYQSGQYDVGSSNPNDYLYGNPSQTTYYSNMMVPGDTTATVGTGLEGGIGSDDTPASLSVDGSKSVSSVVPGSSYTIPPGAEPPPSFAPVTSSPFGVSGPNYPSANPASSSIPSPPAYFPTPTKGYY